MGRYSNNTALNLIVNQLAGSSISPTGNETSEVLLISVDADPKSGTLDLASGTTNQVVKKVMVSMPGATGDIIIGFYDGAPSTTLLREFYLINMPSDGFVINKALASGTLGVKVTGCTNPTKKAYLSVQYGY